MTTENPYGGTGSRTWEKIWDEGYAAGDDDARNFRNVLLQGKLTDLRKANDALVRDQSSKAGAITDLREDIRISEDRISDQRKVIRRLDTNRLELKAEVANLTRCNDQQVKIIEGMTASADDNYQRGLKDGETQDAAEHYSRGWNAHVAGKERGYLDGLEKGKKVGRDAAIEDFGAKGPVEFARKAGFTEGYEEAVKDMVVHLQGGESTVMFLTADQFVKLQGAHGVLDGVLGDIESPPR